MQTQHYGFKLFEAAEKPTWLNDWNTTMTKIDTTIARITGGGGDTPDLSELTQRVQALEGRVDSDELRLNVVEGDIVSMLETLSGVQAAISSLTSDVSSLRSDLTSGLAGLQTSLDNLSTTVGSISTALDTLSGRVTTAEGTITQQGSDISDLDTRVTTLENASSGSTGAGGYIWGHIAGYGNSASSGTKKGDLFIFYNMGSAPPATHFELVTEIPSSVSYVLSTPYGGYLRYSSLNYSHRIYRAKMDFTELVSTNSYFYAQLRLMPFNGVAPYGKSATGYTIDTLRGKLVTFSGADYGYEMLMDGLTTGTWYQVALARALPIHPDAEYLPSGTPNVYYEII